MSDYGALAAAHIISDTLWIQEFGRTMRDRSNLHQLAADNALLRQQCAEIVERHNQLVGDYSELMRRAVNVAKESDQKTATIAELQKANADLEAECERLRQHNIEISLDLALLRQIDKQRDPDAYPLG